MSQYCFAVNFLAQQEDDGFEELAGVWSGGSRDGLTHLDPGVRQKVYAEGGYHGRNPSGDLDELEDDVRKHLYDRGYDSSLAGDIVDDILEGSEEPVNGEDIKSVLRDYEEELERVL